MGKRKRGLHKEITSIFDGVPMPKKPQGPQTGTAPGPDSEGSDMPAPAADAPAPPQAPKPKPPVATPKPKPPVATPKPKPPVAAPKTPAMGQTQQAVKSTPKVIATAQPMPEAKVLGSLGGAKRSGWQGALMTLKDKFFATKPGADAAKQKKMAVLVAALVVVSIFVYTKVLKGPKGTTTAPTGPEATVVAAGSTQISWEIPKPYPADLRDPMQFGSVTPVTDDPDQPGNEQLAVKGILFSEDNPAAVIGIEIVHVNDEIAGVKVIKIMQDSVEFEKDGKRWVQKVQK